MKTYRVTIEVNEIVQADNELQAIELVEEMGYQYKVGEIVNPFEKIQKEGVKK